MSDWKDLIGLWAVKMATDNLRPAMGEICWVGNDDRFQWEGSNAVSVDEIRNGHVLLFADKDSALRAFQFQEKLFEQAYHTAQLQKQRAQQAERIERLKAVKARLGVKEPEVWTLKK